MVVFGVAINNPSAFRRAIAKLHDAQRGSSSFYVSVVQRDSVQHDV